MSVIKDAPYEGVDVEDTEGLETEKKQLQNYTYRILPVVFLKVYTYKSTVYIFYW